MRIYTIGYGGRKIEEFIDLLKANRIEHIADVRSNPYSRFKDYNREGLEKTLLEAGIGYIHLGKELGGLRERPYTEHMESDEFKAGVERLLEMGGQKRTAIMCAEKDPASCHRRYISDHLAGLGVDVVHIMEGTAVQGRLL
jgi:uncharacterized protein (DUF488 family)